MAAEQNRSLRKFGTSTGSMDRVDVALIIVITLLIATCAWLMLALIPAQRNATHERGQRQAVLQPKHESHVEFMRVIVKRADPSSLARANAKRRLVDKGECHENISSQHCMLSAE